MRILVTGSRGTLGQPLVRELRRRGHEVWGCDLQHSGDPQYLRTDVRDFRQLGRLFSRQFDVVYHLAAEFGRLNGEEYYEQLWGTNVVGTRNVLEWQHRQGFRLVFASSSEIYGEVDAEWLDEDVPLRQAVFPRNDYALSKWVGEQQIRNAELREGAECVRVRLFNAYGPGEAYHPYRSVVCLFCHAALHGKPWTVFENYWRAFQYVDDLILTLASVAERWRAGEVVNVGGAEYRSVKDLSDLVLRETGANPGLVHYVPAEQHNVRNKRPRIDKAIAWLGHTPATTLEEGVPKTLAWMRAQ